jgi:type 1 fimbria pilin
MANQNPQPAMLNARFDIAATTYATGTTFTKTILTQQAYNELIYVYAVQVELLDDNGGSLGTITDREWDIQITSGPNSVPTNNFSARYIYDRGDKTLALSSPVVVTHRQPLQVHIERKDGTAVSERMTVIVNLVSELVQMA